MHNLYKIVAILGMTFALAACGQRVDIPAAHVAKVMTKDGYTEGVLTTSKIRLPWCSLYCDKIVLLSVADTSILEQMELLMPKDRLTMTFDLRLTMTVNPDKIEELFSRISPTVNRDGDEISLSTAYDTYAQQIIRAEAREMLSQFTIAEVMSSREAINSELSARLQKSVSTQTPFIVRYAGLADIKYPPVIVAAQENAAERREQIQQEEAQLEISKVQLERTLQETRLQRAIDVEKAEAEAAVNKILGDSVTPQYVRYRELNALDSIANSQNKVFVPVKMLDTISGQTMLGRQ